jgi:hypothetical protein
MREPEVQVVAREELEVGLPVRIRVPNLGIFEGQIQKIDDMWARGIADSIEIEGARFSVHAHIIELVAAIDLRPGRPAVIAPTKVEIFAAIENSGVSSNGRPYVSGLRDLMTGIIGFDAANSLREREYGGKSVERWFHQFVKVPAVKKAIGELVAEGAIVKVANSNRFESTPDSLSLEFRSSRTGYVSASQQAQAHAALELKRDVSRIAKLRAEAVATVAARYPEAVETELARLIAES